MSMGLGRQVKERQKEDPDHVDEVPVKAGILQLDEIVVADLVAAKQHEHDGHDDDEVTVEPVHA